MWVLRAPDEKQGGAQMTEPSERAGKKNKVAMAGNETRRTRGQRATWGFFHSRCLQRPMSFAYLISPLHHPHQSYSWFVPRRPGRKSEKREMEEETKHGYGTKGRGREGEKETRR